MKDHTIAAFNFKGLTKQAELLVHTGPVLAIAVNLIVWQQRKNALPDLYQLLTCVAIVHDEIIADMKKFATYLEDCIASIIANNKCFCQAPGPLSNMISHFLMSLLLANFYSYSPRLILAHPHLLHVGDFHVRWRRPRGRLTRDATELGSSALQDRQLGRPAARGCG